MKKLMVLAALGAVVLALPRLLARSNTQVIRINQHQDRSRS